MENIRWNSPTKKNIFLGSDLDFIYVCSTLKKFNLNKRLHIPELSKFNITQLGSSNLIVR